jgi:hypothetical protein
MTAQTSTAGVGPKSPPTSGEKPGRPARKRVHGPNVTGGSRDARRIASAVLEVMAGIRTPTDAASALSISMPRYYILEKRALEGLIGACEPRPKGPGRRPDKEVERLRLQVARLEQDVARSQALARAAQRTLGLAPPVKPVARKADAAGKKHRRRRPVVRALKVLDRLKVDGGDGGQQATAGPASGATEGQA